MKPIRTPFMKCVISQNKGQFAGGILSALLIFVVIAMFLSLSAINLDDMQAETAGDVTDVSFNVTSRALESMDTFSGFMVPLSFIILGALFIFLITMLVTQFKK